MACLLLREADNLQTIQDQAAVLRQQRAQGEITRQEMFQKMRDLPYSALLFGQRDFWAMLDVRDAAHAIHLALTADYEGSHVLHIADTCNSTGLPTTDLTSLLYPEVTTWKRTLIGVDTLFSVDRARDLIGFTAQQSIRHFME